MECLHPGWDTEVFGCTLAEYVGTAQLAWASAITCAGRFDPAVFDTRRRRAHRPACRPGHCHPRARRALRDHYRPVPWRR
jgi:hypothetical protein